ncbi:MAG TPA: hypothetical protein VGF14_06335 [Alphaproteobacteria bacterium]
MKKPLTILILLVLINLSGCKKESVPENKEEIQNGIGDTLDETDANFLDNKITDPIPLEEVIWRDN